MVTIALLLGCGLSVLASMAAFAWFSHREGQPRAAHIAFGLALAGALPFFLAMLLPLPFRWAILGFAAAAALVMAGLAQLPVGRAAPAGIPEERLDERDIMFARARLAPGSAAYESYYAQHPEKQAGDDRTRALPGLLSPDSQEAHPPVFAATEATFEWIEGLHPGVDGPVAPERLCQEPGMATAYVKGLARHCGARTVGVAKLQPYHIYSHIGRGAGEYGAPIHLAHRYAVTFTVEMAYKMVGTAPMAPTLLESARRYADAAVVAILLARTIRAMGYPARAHIDGNYRVIAPLVAWDAGLGEFGRLGLLMTPELGPRVRLGTVTTDLPLVPDGRRLDPSVLDFCALCLKCAENCPVRAIPFGARQQIGGTLRWQIDQETCYRYWCAAGTDCARCVAVCPYAHPDTLFHNLVRRATRHSGLARRAAIPLDNLFYGARPRPQTLPDWLPPNPFSGRRDRRHA